MWKRGSFRNKWGIDSASVRKDSPRLTVTARIKGSVFCLCRLSGDFFLFPPNLTFDILFIEWLDWGNARKSSMSWEQVSLPSMGYSPECRELAYFRQFWKGIKVLVNVSSSLTGCRDRGGGLGGSRRCAIAAVPGHGGHSLATWRPVSVHCSQSSLTGKNCKCKIYVTTNFRSFFWIVFFLTIFSLGS